MGRWRPDARQRLERAALELFAEQGFAATTVPQITERAGLTTRTFFRHFADKREVLFAGEAELPALVTDYVTGAPASWGPTDVVVRGLRTVMVPLFDGRVEEVRRRRDVVDADGGLRERELAKTARLADVIGEGLRGRGVDDLTATLTARLGVTVFGVAVGRWLERDDASLAQVLEDTLQALTAVAGAPWAAVER